MRSADLAALSSASSRCGNHYTQHEHVNNSSPQQYNTNTGIGSASSQCGNHYTQQEHVNNSSAQQYNTNTGIGIGAQSTLEGHKIFAQKMSIKNQQNARILHYSCPKNYQNIQIFMIFARKLYKIPKFCMIFARKCPNFT